MKKRESIIYVIHKRPKKQYKNGGSFDKTPCGKSLQDVKCSFFWKDVTCEKCREFVDNHPYRKKIFKLKADLEKAKECIRFYADGEWQEFISSGGVFDTVDGDHCWAFNGSGDNDGDDGGKRARQTLKELGQDN